MAKIEGDINEIKSGQASIKAELEGTKLVIRLACSNCLEYNYNTKNN